MRDRLVSRRHNRNETVLSCRDVMHFVTLDLDL